MRVTQDSGALVETFITDLTDLLVVDSMQVREVAREALGSELSPRLYPRLMKHLAEYEFPYPFCFLLSSNRVIRRITQAAGADLTETFALFLDQVSA